VEDARNTPEKKRKKTGFLETAAMNHGFLGVDNIKYQRPYSSFGSLDLFR
jgi:hypothetical protein